MAYRIRYTATASAAIEGLSLSQRSQFDEIVEFLSTLPHPVRGSTLVREKRVYGRNLIMYLDNTFPFRVYYETERGTLPDRPDIDGWVTIVMLVPD